MIILHTTAGDITIELDEAAAPNTCANFRSYVESGFYDGTIFHRVIDGFMIQGGGMTADMEKKATMEPIKNEANNGLKNNVGTLAMARTGDPHSATAQFFINVNDNDFLNHTSEDQRGWGYAVFAKVTDGMDVVNAMKGVATGVRAGHKDVPVDVITITSVETA